MSEGDFWPSSDPMFAATREDALQRLSVFSQKASRYSRERNHVVPDHTNVSRLSPAIRHRLITETEVAQKVLEKYAFSTVEKFLQEVYWRRYWKGWLAMRPHVWTSYLDDLKILKSGPEMAEVEKISQGQGSVLVMNDFAKELVETGYMHNHARMWFAAYWIHTLRLPWQLGADFFYRHLLDADPASNTLSWRWVAGLQTLGKTYLARRSNIEKYLSSDLLVGREKGLELLENPAALKPVPAIRVPAQQCLREKIPLGSGVTGLWIHEEDLSVEKLVEDQAVEKVILTGDSGFCDSGAFSKVKRKWFDLALSDAVKRCEKKFPNKVTVEKVKPFTQAICAWAEENDLSQVIAYWPEVGPLNDQIPGLKRALTSINIDLIFLERAEDESLRGYATGGFFSFWKKVEPSVRALKDL